MAFQQSRKRPLKGMVQPRKRQKLDEEDDYIEGPLTVYLRLESKDPIRDCVDAWLRTYTDDETSGLIQAVNCLTKFCGADLILSGEDMQDGPANALKKLEEDADQEKKADPPVWKSKKKPLRRRFGDFWKKMIKQCQHVLLPDEYFLQNLLDWCTELSKSQVRSFREASTEMAFLLMQGLIESAVDAEDNLDQCESRLERVTRPELIQNLEDQKAEKQQTIDNIHNYCETIFQMIFVRRYRDTHAPIRVMCLEHLAHWMAGYPSFFLEDIKLKYVGWCLSDKDASVRLAAVECIADVYSQPENQEPMQNFFERFKARLLEMSKDIDNAVSASAINLISIMLKNDLLKANDGDDIQSYIYDRDPTIRAAAAQFIYHDSFVLAEDGDKDRVTINRDDVLEVLAIFGNEMATRTDHKGELDTPANYLVHTLWDSLTCLKAWDVMLKMLLQSEQSEHQRRENVLGQKSDALTLDSNSETLLLYLILSCAKMARGQLHIGDDKPRRRRTKQKMDEDAEIWASFLEVFLARIPEIFQIVQTDTKKVHALVQILRVIPSEEWSLRKLKDLFTKTLQLLQKVYLNNTDETFLTEAATTLSHFVHDEHPLAGEAQRYAYDLANQLKMKFMLFTDEEKFQGTEDERTNGLKGVLARIKCLKRAIHVDELTFDNTFKKVLNNFLLKTDTHRYVPLLLEIATYDLWWLVCDTSFDRISDAEMEIICQLKNFVIENISYSLTLLDEKSEGIFSMLDSLCELIIVLKPLKGEKMNALNTSLGEQDMNNVLRLFAARFESLADETEDEFEDKVLTCITHCIRLCLSDPKVYGRFGALAISQFTRFSLRSDDLIKHCQTAIKKNYGHEVLQDIQFVSLQHIFEDANQESGSLDRLESVAKTLSKMHGVDSSNLDFRPMIYKCLDYGCKDIPGFVDFLEPAIKPFLSRCKKGLKPHCLRHLEDIMTTFPENHERQVQDREGWKMFDEFYSMMRSLCHRGLYDDDELPVSRAVSRRHYDQEEELESMPVHVARSGYRDDDEEADWMPRLR